MQRMQLVLVIAIAACGPSTRGNGGDDEGGDGGNNGKEDAYCPTAITGKVFAPNGTLPLNGVVVYAPVSDPPPFTDGVQCGTCASTLPGGAYASTTSDASGSFRLEGIPAGTNVPIIVTTGKWRRKLTVPTVAACTDNAIPDGTFRLPKNRTEGEMPKIAIVTGGCDGLACILAQIGIDSTEFGDSAANKAVTFFNGAGGSAPGSPQQAPALWNNLTELKKYDVVINSCECSENNGNKQAPAQNPDLLRQYADLGGRVLGTHFHYTWTRNLIPAWQGTASWNGGSAGNFSQPDKIDMTHPTGMALGQWLINVGGSTQLGDVVLGTKTNNAGAVVAPTTRWLYSNAATNPTTHYLSFNTPVGMPPENQCGKVVYAGMHVSEPSSGNTVNASFPSGCDLNNFTPEEKAFVFLLFDLQSCVTPIF